MNNMIEQKKYFQFLQDYFNKKSSSDKNEGVFIKNNISTFVEMLDKIDNQWYKEFAKKVNWADHANTFEYVSGNKTPVSFTVIDSLILSDISKEAKIFLFKEYCSKISRENKRLLVSGNEIKKLTKTALVSAAFDNSIDLMDEYEKIIASVASNSKSIKTKKESSIQEKNTEKNVLTQTVMHLLLEKCSKDSSFFEFFFPDKIKKDEQNIVFDFVKKKYDVIDFLIGLNFSYEFVKYYRNSLEGIVDFLEEWVDQEKNGKPQLDVLKLKIATDQGVVSDSDVSYIFKMLSTVDFKEKSVIKTILSLPKEKVDLLLSLPFSSEYSGDQNKEYFKSYLSNLNSFLKENKKSFIYKECENIAEWFILKNNYFEIDCSLKNNQKILKNNSEKQEEEKTDFYPKDKKSHVFKEKINQNKEILEGSLLNNSPSSLMFSFLMTNKIPYSGFSVYSLNYFHNKKSEDKIVFEENLLNNKDKLSNQKKNNVFLISKEEAKKIKEVVFSKIESMEESQKINWINDLIWNVMFNIVKYNKTQKDVYFNFQSFKDKKEIVKDFFETKKNIKEFKDFIDELNDFGLTIGEKNCELLKVLSNSSLLIRSPSLNSDELEKEILQITTKLQNFEMKKTVDKKMFNHRF